MTNNESVPCVPDATPRGKLLTSEQYMEKVREMRLLLGDAYSAIQPLIDHSIKADHDHRVWGLVQAQQDLGNLNNQINAILDPESNPYKS